MSTARRFVKNSLMITASALTTKLFSLFFFVCLVRYLGEADFGRYSFVFALMNFFVIFVAFGIDDLTVREVARDRGKAGLFVVNASLVKTALVGVCWATLPILLHFMRKDSFTVAGIVMVALFLLPDAFVKSFNAVFSAHERMELNTLIEVLFRVTLVGLGLCAIFLDWGGRIIFAFSLVGGMASLTCALVLFRKVVGPLRVRVDWGLCRYLVTEGFPFLLTGAFITIYHRIDTVMLFWMKGETAAGWYGAAHGLTDALLLVPVAAHGAVYPVLSRLYGQTKQGLQTAFGLVFNSLLLLVLPIGTGTTVLAGTIVQAAFPPEFRHSTIAVQLLIWTVVLVYLNAPMSALLCSAHRQRRLAVIVFWMAVLNIVLNLALIPRWGHAGAALATVVTELFGFIWIVRTISGSIVSIHWIPRLLKSALATAAMTGVVLALGGLSVYFRIASGAAVYLAVLFALRPFDHGEIQIAKSLLAARGRALAG